MFFFHKKIKDWTNLYTKILPINKWNKKNTFLIQNYSCGNKKRTLYNSKEGNTEKKFQGAFFVCDKSVWIKCNAIFNKLEKLLVWENFLFNRMKFFEVNWRTLFLF